MGTAGGDVPANVLLMLDVSGSMDTVMPTGETKYPVDVVHDSAGNIYVATFFDLVEKYDANGKFLFKIESNFDETYAVAVDSSDNVYVADHENGRVKKFNSQGSYIRTMTLSRDPARGIAVDKNNYLYAINGKGKIEKFNSSGSRIQTWSNTEAYHVATDASNNVYVTTLDAKKILKYNSSGTLLQTINTSFEPFGIDIASNGNIYVSDINGSKIHAYTPAGAYIQSWGSTGTGVGQFKSPRGIGFDNSGTLWVSDYQNNRVQSLTGALKLNTATAESRLEQAVKIIKGIVSDSSLTEKINFGLMKWSSSASMLVGVSSSGAAQIYNVVDSLNANGGTNLDSAMTLAQSYILGASNPMNINVPCQKNILIVISDGEWVDNSASNTAKTLYNTYNIQTYAVGFQALDGSSSAAAANYEKLSKNGGSYPESPVYADNAEQLNDVLRQYLKFAIDSSLTFSVPTIIPGVSGDDYILQSVFEYNTIHQWKGHLLKYALTTNGDIGELLWDAGSVLNNVAANSRSIWTVATSLPSGLNNFTTANRELLRSSLQENMSTSFTTTEISNLIDFVRGKDSYGEFPTGKDNFGTPLISGERWKLGDIYNSRAIVVGPPSAYFSATAPANSEAYYRYTNGYESFTTSSACGTVCSDRMQVVYAGSNDGMLHAFNSATGAELWAFIPPGVLPNFKDMIMAGNKSSSIYGVDGSPMVKDIYYGGQWRTILMGGLRQGGHSYYALDVTNPNNPQHLFSFAYNKVTNKVSYWNAAGARTDYSAAGTVPAAYNFSALGEAWSQPVITKIKISGADKWVAIIAGGYNSGVSTAYGTKLYVLDLADGGKILNTLTLADGNASNNIVNSVPPRVTAITADDTATFPHAGALVYVTDLEGKLWKINLTNSGTLYDQTKLFDGEATAANDRYSFYETAATLNSSGKLIQFFGTGNQQALERKDAAIANRAFGIVDTNFPNFSSVTTATVSSLRNITNSCPANSQQGWYLNFNTNEKICARATVANSTVFLSRFTPNTGNACQAGTSRLTQHDFVCGNVLQTTELGAGIATEAVIYKNKLYIGISDGAEGELPEGFTKKGNLITGTPAITTSGDVNIEAWWEEF